MIFVKENECLSCDQAVYTSVQVNHQTIFTIQLWKIFSLI